MTSPYTYTWDNSTSITNNPVDLPAGLNTLTIVDANGCDTTYSFVINEPSPLVIDSITQPSSICPGGDITISVYGSGGSSPYIFTWFENGNQISNNDTVDVSPSFDNTQYCVVLSETCGSPTTDTCTTISYYTDITPTLSVNETENCTGEFYITNTSVGNIESTYYQFSNGSTYLDFDDSLFVNFTNPGQYSVDVTIESIYGCIYNTTFNNIVTYHDGPVANFNFSSNPTTFFETTVNTQDASSPDVVSWYWISTSSYPSQSNLNNVSLTFPEGVVAQYDVMLIVTNEWGCSDTTIRTLSVIQDVLVYAPTAFTPDGDEFNQDWGLVISGIDNYDFNLSIYNRWGEVIWESHDPSARWDGTYKGAIVQDGSYIWVASFGITTDDSRYTVNGTVNIIK